MTARAVAKVAAGAAVLVALAATPASAVQGPDVKPVLQGTRGTGDWWRSSVRLSWEIAPAPDSTSGCDTRMLSQETAGTSFTCEAMLGGVTTSVSVVIRIDSTPPVAVTAAAARPPDAGGWYTSPVDIAWSGSDALSGIAACTSVAYREPDNGAASLSGTCTDKAGNASAAVPFMLAFDATPPALGAISSVATLGRATLSWTAPPDAAQVTVTRTAGTRGVASRTLPPASVTSGRAVDERLSAGVRYSWTVTVRDAAGNVAAATASAIWTPPVLRWHRRRDATYYNVQVFRHDRKILSNWPRKTSLGLKGQWRFDGKAQGLEPGVYEWYAWPGYGPRAARRYGRLITHGRFTVS